MRFQVPQRMPETIPRPITAKCFHASARNQMGKTPRAHQMTNQRTGRNMLAWAILSPRASVISAHLASTFSPDSLFRWHSFYLMWFTGFYFYIKREKLPLNLKMTNNLLSLKKQLVARNDGFRIFSRGSGFFRISWSKSDVAKITKVRSFGWS